MKAEEDVVLEVDHNLLVLLNGSQCSDLLSLGFQAAIIAVFVAKAPKSVGKAGVVDAGDVVVQSTLNLVEEGILKDHQLFSRE